MNDMKIAVLGGDRRQSYLIRSLEKHGCTVSSYGINGVDESNCDTVEQALSGVDAVILPYPVSPDGVYLNAICENCNLKLNELFESIKNAGINTVIGGGFKKSEKIMATSLGICVYDYGESEVLKIQNALCTAEGAIEIAMRELSINIHASKCAVLGYGRIGKLLAMRLKALEANVCVFARRDETLVAAQTEGFNAQSFSKLERILCDCDVIFNTVPAPVIDKKILSTLNNDSLVIDLASSPGGVDFTESEKMKIRVIWALSLPGKCSPKSAAEIICDAALSYLKERGGCDI